MKQNAKQEDSYRKKRQCKKTQPTQNIEKWRQRLADKARKLRQNKTRWPAHNKTKQRKWPEDKAKNTTKRDPANAK